MRIKFIVPAVPIAQPRQRHSIRGSGESAFVHNYTPTKHKVTDFKASVRMAFAEAYQGPPLAGALTMNLVFVFPRAKGKFWKKKPMPRYAHAIKPDADNCYKSVADALKGIAFWDDSQIAASFVQKFVASGIEMAHVEVEIYQQDGP